MFVKYLTKFADDLTSVWSCVGNEERSVNSENAFAAWRLAFSGLQSDFSSTIAYSFLFSISSYEQFKKSADL